MAKKMKPRAPKEFVEELVQLDRVSYVVKGGRRMRFRATMLIGDQKGRVGMGIGKANEVVDAIRKGVAEAKRNLVSIDIVNDTIPHTTRAKFKASKVLLLPASDGTGVIAGGVVRRVCQLVGIPNILSKSMGSRNKINMAIATMNALSNSKIFDGLVVNKSFDETIKEREEVKKRAIDRAAAEEKAAKEAEKKRKKDEEATKKAEEKAAKEAEKAAAAEAEAPSEEAPSSDDAPAEEAAPSDSEAPAEEEKKEE